MPTLRAHLLTALLTWALADELAGQQGAPRLLNGDESHRAARLALTGDLGLPELKPLTLGSPRNTLYFADRFPIAPPDATAYAGSPPVIFDGLIPAGAGGTGTIFPEIFKYQLGNSYDENGPPHPVVVAYHGFGSSANSVAVQSLIDEECDARGWVYVSPTGLDDQLFGSPICQQHISVVIQWLLDNFNVDPDRIYMVGFSMGGGVVTSYAARHRDPDGIMIAAVGSVSATLDWSMEWHQGAASVKTLLQNVYNFGGTPGSQLFNYLQSSALHFTQGTYPPLPGTLDEALSMARNNGPVPTYVTYDTGDTIAWVPGVNDALIGLLEDAGGTVEAVITSGTLDGGGAPAPHSWAVLDEVDLCDFFEGRSVTRRPATFDGLQDLGGEVSWAETIQATAGDFTVVSGSALPASDELILGDVANARRVVVDASAAEVDAMPVRITASGAPGEDFLLELTGFASSPSYLLDAATSTLVGLVDSDPAAGSLLVGVEAGTVLDAWVIHDEDWSGVLTTDPNPAPIGSTTEVALDGPAGANGAWTIVSAAEALIMVKGVLIAALPVPPAVVVFLPLDGQGDLTFTADIPNDGLLVGLRLPTQAIFVGSGGTPLAVSNLWGFAFE